MDRLRRRTLLGGAVCAALAGRERSAHGQIVGKPVRIVFPFAAGGAADAMARLIAEKLRISLGRPVLVESVVGAAGRRGIQMVATSPPDGDTLLFAPNSQMTIYPHVYESLQYDPFNDFAPLSQVATYDFGLAVGRQVPAESLAKLLDWIKLDSIRATYATAAAGTLPHFFAILFTSKLGVQFRHVPYRGSAAAMTDLLAGQIPMLFTTTAELVQHHKAKSIRVLATSGDRPSPFLENVPSFREAGYDIGGTGWYALYAPASTAPPAVERLSREIAAAASSRDVMERALSFGMVTTGTTGAKLAAIQKSDYDFWGPIVKASGFKPSD